MRRTSVKAEWAKNAKNNAKKKKWKESSSGSEKEKEDSEVDVVTAPGTARPPRSGMVPEGG